MIKYQVYRTRTVRRTVLSTVPVLVLVLVSTVGTAVRVRRVVTKSD